MLGARASPWLLLRRYRGKLGLDVALEALRDALSSRAATVDQIVRAAEVCRIRTVITPHMEATLM